MAGEDYRRLAKEGSWIIAGQLAAVVGALTLVRVLTEHLTPEQYGQLALGLTVAGLVNQTVTGGITTAAGRFYSIAAERQDIATYLLHCRRLMGYATAAVVAIGALLIGGLLAFAHTGWVALAAAALALAIFNSYSTALNSIQNAARQRAAAAIHGGLDAWLKIAFAVLAIIWLGSSSASVVLGYVLSSSLICGSQFLFLRRSLGRQTPGAEPETDWLAKMWAYAWPFSIWGLFSWAQQVSDRWALQTFGSTEDVGLYAVVFQLGYSPIGLVAGMVVTFLGPILYQRSGNATDGLRNESVHRLAWRITGVALATTLLGFFAALVLHGWMFDLLVASRYRAASPMLPWMVLAGGIFAAGQMLALKLLAEMRSAAMTVAKIATAILGILLNLYGAAHFGAEGVVAALIACSVVYFIWMAWLARRTPSLHNADQVKS